MNIDIDKVASAIRDVAATEILPRWRNLAAGDIQEKTGPQDLVTIADQAAEKALSAKLLSLYPETVVVGEEGVEADPSKMDLFKQNQPIWVIDPIDGTMAFAGGKPEFDVMLALTQNHSLDAGWIYSPVQDDMYFATREHGAMRIHKKAQAQKLSAPTIHGIKNYTGILGNKLLSKEHRDFVKSQEPKFTKIYSSISAGHDYAMLMRGEAQFAVYGKCMPWDHLPGLTMLSCLGFVYCKHDGSAYVPGDTTGGLIIAPNKSALDEIRAIVMAMH
ncbi:MAG: inositol monophosphatase [Alphaproteobacteria bacterium]|nr:inositol monophosphatase [Alphaproteobacteria bacterium]